MKKYKPKTVGDPVKRPEGYYWVQLKNKWVIGYHFVSRSCDGGDFDDVWDIGVMGDEQYYKESDFDEINEHRIVEPNECICPMAERELVSSGGDSRCKLCGKLFGKYIT